MFSKRRAKRKSFTSLLIIKSRRLGHRQNKDIKQYCALMAHVGSAKVLDGQPCLDCTYIFKLVQWICPFVRFSSR